MCDKGFIWNPSNCECECDKSCDIDECVDYVDLIDKLIDECTEAVEEVKPSIIILAENENSYKCSSSIVYTVLFWIFFAINIGGIGTYFDYFYWYLKNDSPYVDFNTHKETTIY